MQKLAGRVSPLSRPIATANTAADVVVQGAVVAPSLVDIWRGTITAFIAHAAPLLLIAVIGLAAVPLLSPALMVFSVPLARIAVTQIVAGSAGASVARPGRLPNLLGRSRFYIASSFIVSGIYVTAIIAGQIGMGVPLRAWGLNLNFADQKVSLWESAAQTIAMRTINALSNTADLPFATELRVWRNWAFDEWVEQPNVSYEQKLMADYWQRGPDAANGGGIAGIEAQAQTYSLRRPDLRVLFIGSGLMIVVAETLFVFRSVPGVRTVRLLWLSLTHFGTVAGHLWLLRFVVVGLKVIFVFVPIVVVDRYAYLARDWGWFGSAIQGYALAICLALINAIVSTFEAVYVARLYLALSGLKR